MKLFRHNLILNHITYCESMLEMSNDIEDYMDRVFFYLNFYECHLFESDILGKYPNQNSLESVFAEHPGRFKEGSAKIEKEGVLQTVWYDLSGPNEIIRGQLYFDYFFICKLSHQSLLDIDDYLNFHLPYSFKNDKAAYFRFLQVSLRQYPEKISDNIISTVQEWIAATAAQPEQNHSIESDKEDRIKGRITREANDHLTALTLNQTALLIEYMQQAGIILKGDYLTYTQAGKAFNLLTGYSSHTLRQQLGTRGSVENMIKNEDYKELYETMLKLIKLIEPKLRK